MKMTGSILKENRERKGITLNEVSIATKITLKTLKAIEEGDRDALPPRTFVRGFVKSYAQYLGLNLDEILNVFKEEMGDAPSAIAIGGESAGLDPKGATPALPGDPSLLSNGPAAKPASENEHNRSPASKPLPSLQQVFESTNSVRNIAIAGGTLVLLVLIAVARQKMSSYEAEKVSSLEPAQIETADQNAPVVPNAEKEADAAEVATGTPSTNPPDLGPSQAKSTDTSLESAAPSGTTAQPAVASAQSKPSSPPSTGGPAPAPAVAAVKPPAPVASTPPPTTAPATAPAPAPSRAAGSPPKTKEVLIEALGQVDVELVLDGEAPRKLSLKADQVQSIRIQEKAVLKLSDGGRVNIVVDGVDRGVPGDLGKPKKVELP